MLAPFVYGRGQLMLPAIVEQSGQAEQQRAQQGVLVAPNYNDILRNLTRVRFST